MGQQEPLPGAWPCRTQLWRYDLSAGTGRKNLPTPGKTMRCDGNFYVLPDTLLLLRCRCGIAIERHLSCAAAAASGCALQFPFKKKSCPPPFFQSLFLSLLLQVLQTVARSSRSVFVRRSEQPSKIAQNPPRCPGSSRIPVFLMNGALGRDIFFCCENDSFLALRARQPLPYAAVTTCARGCATT